MSHTTNATARPGEPKLYHIRVQGHLGPRWERWFDQMAIIPHANGDTVLTGPVVDQAALHGLLRTLRDLGLSLVSVMEVDSDQATGPAGNKE